MKPLRFSSIVTLIAVMGSLVLAAGTPCGTEITNVAYGDYDDANGNAMPQVQSNVVSTIVSQVAGVDLNPDYHSNTIPTQAVHLSFITLTNTGNCDDAFDLTLESEITGTGTFDITLWHDIDGNGIIDGLDSLITVTPNMAADEELNLIYRIEDTTPGGAPDGDNVYTNLIATSQFDETVSDNSEADHTIAAAVLAVSVEPSTTTPEPGDVITFSVCGSNTGSAISYGVTIIGEIPANSSYVPGSMAVYSTDDYANASPLTDPDDGVEYPPLTEGDFNVTNAGQVTIVWGDAAPGESGCVFYQVVVDEDTPEGTVIEADVTVGFDNSEGTPYPSGNYTSTPAVVQQVYAVSSTGDEVYFADPSDDVLYPICFTNDGNGDDIFNISYTSNFWSWTFYFDQNGNGVIDPDDTELTDTINDGIIDIGSLGQDETVCIIGMTTVPAGTNDGTSDVMTVTATSVGDPTVTTSGTATITATAPYLTLSKMVTPTGNQPPGTVLTYRVDVINAGTGQATGVLITDAIPTNCTYVAGSLSVAGIAKTDAADGDNGTFSNDSVIFDIPTLGSGGSTYVTFQVTID